MPGGFLRWEALSLVGPLGEGLFDKVNIQTAFMGAAGFALDAGLSDATDEEAQIKRLMVQGASRTVALVDHTQVGAGGVRHVLPDRRPRRRRDRRPGARRDARRRPAARDRGPARLAGRRRRARDAPARPGGGADPVVTPVAVEPDGAAPATRSLALRGVSKSFGPTQAVSDVSLELRAGEVHALVGENGAGKSTLVKIIGGVHQPDEGTIVLDGTPVVLQGPAHARALGIAVVHQEPRLFPDLSVAENVFLGHAPTGALRSVDWGAMRRQARALFEELDVRFDVQAPVRGLSMADQQLIEIAKALSVDARVLILDEPTASLSAHEVAAPVLDRARPARPRRRGAVRQPPAGRGVRPVRHGDGAARRQARDHPAHEGPDHGRPDPAHGRAGGDAVPEGGHDDRRRAARGRTACRARASSTT